MRARRPLRSVLLLLLLLLLPVTACGGDDGGTSTPTDGAPADTAATDGASIDSPPVPQFSLTSSALTDGGAIPSSEACTSKGGMNMSPPLVIANPPTGTMSYAIVLTDLSNQLVHCAIYDIPAATTSIAADIDKVYAPPDVAGAHQPNNYSGTRGWAGPCPPNAHMYQLKIYALSTATVPTATMGTTKDQLVTQLQSANLGTTTLTGTFTPP